MNATTFEATILTAQQGRRLTKLYRDPSQPPEDYDAGFLFTATEISCPTFADFIREVLAQMPSDSCLIRGRVRDDARADVEADLPVRRLAYDDVDGEGNVICSAAFEPAERNWIVLDFDETRAPFDVQEVQASVRAWHATLPPELRDAQAAFFLSASSHRHATVRGKLVVALAGSIDNDTAAAWAKALGADSSICHTVQPNYFAAPLFVGCADPLVGHRAPIMFEGVPATLPALPVTHNATGELGAREAVPDDLSALSERGTQLVDTIQERWLDGNRVEGNAWLHLAGWALAQGWSKGELGAVLVALDAGEDDARKRAEHWHILGNARAIDGPGGARAWLGEGFAAVDAIIGHDSVMAAYAARLESRIAGEATPQGAPPDVSGDPIDEFESAQGTLLGELEPRSFLVPELELGVGRPYGWLGKSNASKTIAAMQLEIDLALGRPVFGRFDGPGHPVPVLRIAYEGFAKAREDYRRIINGTSETVDLEALDRRLRFIDGQRLGRYITNDIESNYEWLTRATAKFGGGLCVIDPLVAACLGLDENSTEIAQPLYALERVSRENNVAFLLAHHFGHEKARARGSSAIEAVFGASCAIAKDEEAGSMTLERQATQHKRDRYGFEPFTLTIRDVNADGTAFVPTSDDRKAQRASWGLRIEAKAANGTAHAERTPRALESFKVRRAAAERNAERITELLATADRMGTGMTARKIRGALGLNAENWQNARDLLKSRGVIVEATLPSEAGVSVRLVTSGDGTAPPRMPQAGDVARTGRRR